MVVEIMTAGLLFRFVFYFFGTFLHELAHYIAALFLGKAEGFSVRPKREGNRIVFGSVRSRTRFRVLSSFIAAAPIIWWAVLFMVLRHLHVIDTANHIPGLRLGVIAQKVRTFSLPDFIYLWLLIQILWAGRLSLQDLKNFSRGLISVSGISLILAVAALIYVSRRFLLNP